MVKERDVGVNGVDGDFSKGMITPESAGSFVWRFGRGIKPGTGDDVYGGFKGYSLTARMYYDISQIISERFTTIADTMTTQMTFAVSCRLCRCLFGHFLTMFAADCLQDYLVVALSWILNSVPFLILSFNLHNFIFTLVLV